MKKYFILIFLLIGIIIFSNNAFEKYIASLIVKDNLKLQLKVIMEITKPTVIESDVYFLKNRYLIIKINKPELFSGIDYVYDIFENIFYTSSQNHTDSYEEVNVLTASIPQLFQGILISFKPEKLNHKSFIEDEMIIDYYEPKTKNFLKLLNVDFVKFKVFFKQPKEEILMFEKFQILNSQENKKIDFYITEIDNLKEEELDDLINNIIK
ncbi:hypothetical protein OF820_13640 [Oceanotoga sp. DSM 15011]|uniref:hypothetical protein n=1 Tax=Oceanotoga sp. DSM 15011 TaxID=2984951 RepID=UPI0021F48D86|nr:hypothetical protein [Oceanotoga sp. DSM 15011]UYP00074.1 hypothetical protein OF820_13640 [Oceanotoga sp. DSM 15011]